MKRCKDLNELVTKYDKEVEAIILSILNRYRMGLTDLHDMKQKVYLQMHRINTIERFDEKHNVKFSSYIFKCIKNSILAHYAYNKKYTNEAKDKLDIENFDDDLRLSLSIEKKLHNDLFYDKLLEYIPHANNFTKRTKKICIEFIKLTRTGHTHKDIADKLGYSVAGIGTIQKRTVDIARQLLKSNRTHTIGPSTVSNHESI